MPRWSEQSTKTLAHLRAIEEDATSASSLARRAGAVLAEALRLDEVDILAVDHRSLLFTRVLSIAAPDPGRFVGWLRDVYLAGEPREPDDLTFPALMRHHDGLWVGHEDLARWYGTVPRPPDAVAFRDEWRRIGSPPGGGMRLGLAHRGRWVAAMQMARWAEGPGLRPSEVELVRRIRPGLAAAFARLVAMGAPDAASADSDETPLPYRRESAPAAGVIVFDPDRRLRLTSRSAIEWLERLPADSWIPGLDDPLPVQGVVAYLARHQARSVTVEVVDRYGVPIEINGEPATSSTPDAGGGAWTAVSLRQAAQPLPFDALSSRQLEVARAVAAGLDDRSIATRLGVSPSTVHDHVSRLHRLAGTRSRVSLALALSQGLRRTPR